MINIRLAKLTDAKEIAKAHVSSWQKIYKGFIPDRILDALSVDERKQQWLERLSKNVRVLVLELDGDIVGFASLCPSRDKDTDPRFYAEISAIYLRPDVWFKSLGKKLCLAAISELEMMGFSHVIVWVLKDNTQARNFYEKLGFEATQFFKEEKIRGFTLSEIRYYKKLSKVFTFKPLQESDLELLCRWFAEPHVKEWWNDNLSFEAIKFKYKKRIGGKIVSPYIVYINDRAIGFIQSYQADKVGEGWWPNEKEGTVGIDQFIGESDLINRGIGTLMIRAFIDHLLQEPSINKIITDVDPKNLRAIRCYEKTGLKFVREVNTPDGVAFLMELVRR
jgi:RimJ/RimL family protein N-acetyltransferase